MNSLKEAKIDRLKRKLFEAQVTLERLQQEGTSLLEMSAAYKAINESKSALAAAEGREYAIELDMGVFPEAAVSGARLFQDEYHSFLTFNAMRPRPDGLRGEAGTAIVELIGCTVTKFGHPNDEALPGHRLYHSGLGGYGIFEVHNSVWIDEVVRINQVCFPKTVRKQYGRHFMFVFHDSSLECIARDIHLEVKPYSPRFEKVIEVLRAWGRMHDALHPIDENE